MGTKRAGRLAGMLATQKAFAKIDKMS